MKHLPFLAAALLVGCGGSTKTQTPMSEQARRAFCYDNLEDSGRPYSVIESDDWRLGDLPLWSTPDLLRSTWGSPDSTFKPYRWTDALGVLRYVVAPDTLWFGTVGDSLAYPFEYPLRLGPLSTSAGAFALGTPASAVEAAFPLSYRCRNWPLAASIAFMPYDTEVLVDDTTGGGRIALWLRNDSLIAVGVDAHFGSADERVPPGRAD